MNILEAKSVVYSYGEIRALNGVTLGIEKGGFLGILGPNGSGKTTLLRCLTGVLRPSSGIVTLAGRDLATLSRKEVAQMVSVVAQYTEAQFDFTVLEYVFMGRLPHLGRFQREGPKDVEKVEWALGVTGASSFKDRPVTSLSGGERQRVILAMALAQDPSVLMLDEPTSHLDIRYQVEMLDLVKDLNRTQGITVVAVLHDTNLAATYCDDLVLLQDGMVFATGPTKDVYTRGNMEALYAIDVVSVPHPETGVTLVFPSRRTKHLDGSARPNPG